MVSMIWIVSIIGMSAPALLICAAALVAIDIQLHADSMLDHACAFTALPVLDALIHGMPMQLHAPSPCSASISMSSDMLWAFINVLVVYMSRYDQTTTIFLVLVATAGTAIHLSAACFDSTMSLAVIRTIVFYLVSGGIYFCRAAMKMPLQPNGHALLSLRDGPLIAAPILIIHEVIAFLFTFVLLIMHCAMIHRFIQNNIASYAPCENMESGLNDKDNTVSTSVLKCSGNSRSSSRERSAFRPGTGKPVTCDDNEWAQFCAAKAASEQK